MLTPGRPSAEKGSKECAAAQQLPWNGTLGAAVGIIYEIYSNEYNKVYSL
jgi:hypothetical protein